LASFSFFHHPDVWVRPQITRPCLNIKDAVSLTFIKPLLPSSLFIRLRETLVLQASRVLEYGDIFFFLGPPAADNFILGIGLPKAVGGRAKICACDMYVCML
jgi:hypothetical protein